MPTLPLRRLLPALLLAALAWPGGDAAGFVEEEDRFQVHGFYRTELRVLNDNFEPESDWYVSQFAHTLNLELEWDIAPDGWGPFSLVSAFSRVEVRFDCVWTSGCGIFNHRKIFGEWMTHSPTKVYTDGRKEAKTGLLLNPAPDAGTLIHQGSSELVPFLDVPPIDLLKQLGGEQVEQVFAPAEPFPLVAARDLESDFDNQIAILGPFNLEAKFPRSGALLLDSENTTVALPLRPAVPQPGTGKGLDSPQGLWVPHHDVRQRLDDFDDPQLNLTDKDLRWNHGAIQDERELKELYVDLELLDGRLFFRLGKQTIVWGKTEIFRNQDQFNPQDLALSTLPDLETSRQSLWTARGIYSFYNVGPFQDVRLELAVLLDDFEPADLGRCGEPYTIWLICRGNFGQYAHGFSGLGIGGIDRPPDPWNSTKGIEAGARLEFRWNRFSFAITDYYGYDDFPTPRNITTFERKVDPETGRPLDVFGRELDPDDPEQALLYHPANRQLFDVFCAASVGIAANVIPEPSLADACSLTVFNESEPLEIVSQIAPPGLEVTLQPSPSIANAFGTVLSGSTIGWVVLQAFSDIDNFDFAAAFATPNPLIALNQDVNDAGAGFPEPTFCNDAIAAIGAPGIECLSPLLTDEQEALLGCGPFYGTHCDIDGIDLFQAEASVLFQAFPQFEPGGPVATRYEDGRLWILPGARGPGDESYDPRVDGCVTDGHPLCAGARDLIDPRSGRPFRNEMEALSFNLLQLLAAIGETQDEECDSADPISCPFVRGLFRATGVQRPDVRAGGNERFGRRDWIWNGGSPVVLQYEKRNILGFAMDFAEDRTKTNWGVELTWVEDDALSVTTKRKGYRKADVWNLSVSIDRPTFVNFLNQNRTFLFNTQLFLKYIPEYERQNVYSFDNGPLSVLATFTIFTGYFQDRLLVFNTFVHDFSSASGGVIFSVIYRFTENLSASVSVSGFYGGPEENIQPLYPPNLGNNGGDFKVRDRFLGLSALAERDEVGLTLRYSF